MSDHAGEWQVFIENRAEVVAALERGECDGILPAARGFLDGFAQFLLASGVLSTLEAFPDGRQRRSIPIFFFCNVLIHRPLFSLPRLAPIERTLFRSPYILRQLGFNALQIRDGFYQSYRQRHPFTVEAIPECFADTAARDFQSHQQQVLHQLATHCPGQFLRGLWVMDSVHIAVPRGAHTEAFAFQVCVLGLWQDEVVWPMMWAFASPEEAECVVGKQVFAAAEEVLGQGAIKHLLVDRGYVDGNWISTLYEHGTRVTIGVREDMQVFEELRNLSLFEDTVWSAVEPPQRHDAQPVERAVTGFTDLQGEWNTCRAPLCGCLIRDRYIAHTVYQGLVTTAVAAEATTIAADNRKRWTEEEVFMALTRYWRFDDLPPCRSGVAYALVHFALVAFTLLGFYLQESAAPAALQALLTAPPPFPLPERELAVYAGPYFTLLMPSQLLQIILTHMDAWQANQENVLMTLRLCEGTT